MARGRFLVQLVDLVDLFNAKHVSEVGLFSHEVLLLSNGMCAHVLLEVLLHCRTSGCTN